MTAFRALLVSAAAALMALPAAPAAAQDRGVRNIVLVHGAFIDGSGWEGVHKILTKDGYNVRVVQHPTTSLAADVAYTKRVIASLNGPVLLVGHSYGGAVITEAGNDPKVRGLAYLAAFVPDRGESLKSLLANPVPGAPVPPIAGPEDGFLQVKREAFAAAFAADVDSDKAAFMADSQLPWSVDAFSGVVENAAWRTKPSSYLVATDDLMIPPQVQRAQAKRAGATVTETPGSHAVFVARPEVAAEWIRQAARQAAAAH